ncbi:MAG TPA: ABC transporter ATP-binding protein [Acholeplasmataceae bacterium]|jgi:ABC-type multidrug transport system fused ATPase/permease subunit|nr:ABC transporter ATP-binding protein [Acholeplasmataceae bacterium]
MKLLLKISKVALKYKSLYLIAIISTFALTFINLAAPWVLRDMTSIVEAGVDQEDLKKILILTGILLGLYLFKILFRYLSSYLSHKAAWNLVEEMRMKVYNHIQGLPMKYFHDKQTGDLMSRVVNDTSNLELLFAHIIPEIIVNVVTFIGVLAILLIINYKLALLIWIPVPFILISGIIFSKKVRPNFQVSQKAQAELNAKLQDNFSGIQEIQAFNQERYESELVQKRASKFTSAMLRALKYSGVFHPTVEFISSLGIVIVVGFGGYLAYLGEISVADIFGFFMYLSLFYAPIQSVARLLESTQQAYAGAERVMEVLNTSNDITNSPHAYEVEVINGHIRFENVYFQYEENVPVLIDINLEAKPGQMIALVGATGVGKSTLASLISRYYDVDSGNIYIDNHNIKDLKIEFLRNNIAPVLQDTFLFNGTIAENIAYANPSATFEEIVEAAKAARIHDSIMEMPNKYDTQVGERGLRLSGGQKQRVAIARAIIRKAPIIILDEATSSVDSETEVQIQKAINDLVGTRTIIAIAHRLSTIQRADCIYVFHEGRIVEKGTHDELIKLNGVYTKLCNINEEGK